MGIDSSEQYSNGIYRVPKAPSICLGVSDLTVMEMAGAYSTFANNGIHVKPVHILSIEDKNGQVIYRHVPEDRRALPENANYVMVDLLRGSAGVYGLESDVGGKTGTTNDFVDGWFMGITPDLVVGTWVGGADRWIRFRLPSLGQGSYMAKPFFQRFMKRVEKHRRPGLRQN
jgi:penicillin-binding protein 1A